VTRRPVDELLDAISDAVEHDDRERAARLLAAEGRVFLDGHEHVAAEMGFARFLLARGDTAGALRIVSAASTGGRK
jgi:hypothetical protein